MIIDVHRKLRSGDVLGAVADAMLKYGVQTRFVEPGSPWENGDDESFNGKLRDELLNGEIVCSLKEARTLIEQWRQLYNTAQPHSSLGYRPPSPVTKSPFQIHAQNTTQKLAAL